MTTIRRATPEDARILVALIRELAAYEKLLDEVGPSVELLEGHLVGGGAHGLRGAAR